MNVSVHRAPPVRWIYPPSVPARPKQVTRPMPTRAPPTLSVMGVRHRSLAMSEIHPGDIGFIHREFNQTNRHRIISFGQSFVSRGPTPADRGCPHLIHSFIVLGVKPWANRLVVADAMATKTDDGIAVTELDFGVPTHVNIDPGSDYLFYRFRSPELTAEILRIARHWSRSNSSNFSYWHCFLVPFRHKWQSRRGVERLLYMARFAGWPRAVPTPDGRSEYKMMCSEFVGNVTAVAAMSLYARRHRLNPASPVALRALQAGWTGHVFDDCDIRALTPCALQARMSRDPACAAVGYRPSISTGIEDAIHWPIRHTQRHPGRLSRRS